MKLKYFLDHPQIKRHESWGNGNRPGSIAEKINWGGKNSAPSSSTPAPKAPSTSSSSSSASSGIMSGIKSLFKGK